MDYMDSPDNNPEEKIKEIKRFMEYTVPPERMEEALDLLEIYQDDLIALQLLHEFYGNLPDADEEMAREIRVIGRGRGVFLLAVMTVHSGFLYLASSEGIEFQGRVAEGVWDTEVIDFFELQNPRNIAGPDGSMEQYSLYETMDSDLNTCPACYAAVGEYHELGCPVEICPWCGGQFTYCNCRFDQLGLDYITDERDLALLEELLEQRGRIPYSPEQRPAFPSVSE